MVKKLYVVSSGPDTRHLIHCHTHKLLRNARKEVDEIVAVRGCQYACRLVRLTYTGPEFGETMTKSTLWENMIF